MTGMFDGLLVVGRLYKHGVCLNNGISTLHNIGPFTSAGTTVL